MALITGIAIVHTTGMPVDYFFDLDAVHIDHEQGQDRPSGQPARGGFDTSDFEFILPAVFSMFAHRVLYLLGVFMFVVNLEVFNKHYRTLTNFRGLFSFKIVYLRIH